MPSVYKSPGKRLQQALTLLLFTSVPHLATAQDNACADDSDCDQGFTCESLGFGLCPEISCLAGDEDCLANACESEETSACQPITDCSSDDQCAEGYVCAEQVRVECVDAKNESCTDGESDEECAARQREQAESACTETKVNECTPQWAGECATDSDCGAGFNCELAMNCQCSGSSASAPSTGGGDSADGGTADVDPDELDGPVIEPDQDCSCTPEDYGFCQLKDLPCTEDSDCDDGLVCNEDPNSGICMVAAPPPGAEGTGGATSSEDPCGDAQASMRCMPRYYNYGFGHGLIAATAEVAASGGLAGDGTAVAGPVDKEEDEDSIASGSDDRGNGGSAAQASATEPPSVADAADSGKSGSVGCSVAGPSQALGQLAWLGLPLVLLRRRRKQSAV